jgi:MFS family permease
VYHDPYENPQAAYYQQAATGMPYPMGYQQTGYHVPTPAWGEYDGLREDYLEDESFQKNLQFGIIDNGLLVAMTLAGVSLEDWISDKVGVKGYGAIMGAAVGNAVSDGVAALPQGYKAAAGVTVGCLLPVAPLAVAMVMGKEIKGTTRNVLLASSAALLGYAFLSKRLKAAAGETA